MKHTPKPVEIFSGANGHSAIVSLAQSDQLRGKEGIIINNGDSGSAIISSADRGALVTALQSVDIPVVEASGTRPSFYRG